MCEQDGRKTPRWSLGETQGPCPGVRSCTLPGGPAPAQQNFGKRDESCRVPLHVRCYSLDVCALGYLYVGVAASYGTCIGSTAERGTVCTMKKSPRDYALPRDRGPARLRVVGRVSARV